MLTYTSDVHLCGLMTRDLKLARTWNGVSEFIYAFGKEFEESLKRKLNGELSTDAQVVERYQEHRIHSSNIPYPIHLSYLDVKFSMSTQDASPRVLQPHPSRYALYSRPSAPV
jgi:hypothetical protein